MSEQSSVPPINGPKTLARRLTILAAAAVCAALLYALAPRALDELQRRALAIFLFAAVCWATEALPLYATSLCVIGLCTLLLAHEGGLARVGALSYKPFFAPFGNHIIILFMGGFLLSRAVTKHAVDRVVAARVLSPFARRPLMLLFAVLGITAFFSMWMSNTATAAMMLALIGPLVRGLPANDRFHRAVILAVPFGANIGGIGTPIGTPPNAVALAYLAQAGVRITFLRWMLVAVPLLVLMLLVCGLLLYWAFRPRGPIELARVQPPGRLTGRAWVTVCILVATCLLWLTGQWHGINVGVVALLSAAALTALGVLDRRDVDSIDWNILILMWGGLALGAAMEQTELAEQIVRPLASGSGVQLTVLVVLLALVLSSFMSHTAAANLLIPIAFALSAANPPQLVILAALACSFAMAIPVSTPPNAMAFATGRVPAASMVRVGGLISIIAVIVMLLGYQLMLPLVLGR